MVKQCQPYAKSLTVYSLYTASLHSLATACIPSVQRLGTSMLYSEDYRPWNGLQLKRFSGYTEGNITDCITTELQPESKMISRLHCGLYIGCNITKLSRVGLGERANHRWRCNQSELMYLCIIFNSWTTARLPIEAARILSWNNSILEHKNYSSKNE